MKILVVDDDNFVRTMLTKQLTAEGYEVRAESNVDDALAALESEKFNLLVTDILMPGKDGGYLMRQVKARGVKIPILAVTGGLENAIEDYADYADFFADATLMKPVSKSDLVSTVKKLLKK